jgi:hypothetical protein
MRYGDICGRLWWFKDKKTGGMGFFLGGTVIGVMDQDVEVV